MPNLYHSPEKGNHDLVTPRQLGHSDAAPQVLLSLESGIEQLRRLEALAFSTDPSSPVGLFFALQKIILTKFSLGSPLGFGDWLRIAEQGKRTFDRGKS